MSSKINISIIISGHLLTLKNVGDTKVSKTDYFTFFAIPIIFSVVFYISGFKLTTEITSLLVNFGAIFTALLLSVLVLVYDQGEKLKDKNQEEVTTAILGAKEILLEQLCFNICYSIVVSVALVFLCLIETVITGSMTPTSWSGIFSSLDLSVILFTPLIVFLTLNLMLTILMVVKRMHTLLTTK